jgi:hypothetical protein
MSAITIRPVGSKADKLDFLRVPFAIYANDPNWVAPLFFERLEHLDKNKNPYFKHAAAQLFIAEKDGKPVGRISAQVDSLHVERYNDACGQFGFLEAQNDPEIFAALFSAAENWLRQKGMRRLRGPFSFSINDESGLLVDGFNSPPNMMMGHATPFYAGHVEANGYAKAKDLLAYVRDPRVALPPVMQHILNRSMQSGEIKIRPLKKSDMKNEIQIIMSIFNDAWSNNWGYVPFTQAELQVLATNLKLLVHKESVQIASYRGEDAAFVVIMPNLNEWFAGLDGKLLPRGLPRLLGKLITKKSKSFRIPLMGVRKKYQSGVLGAALSLGAIKAIYDFHVPRGAEEVEMSWILEDNMPMRHMIESFGGKINKTYRIYEKQI